MEAIMNDSGVECCFCAETILETKTDPCDITIMANSESMKSENDNIQLFFWGHAKCIKQRLNQKHQGYLTAILLHKDELNS